jgi:ribonucleotide reductase beta subunit family protein with ferritin-like domain
MVLDCPRAELKMMMAKIKFKKELHVSGFAQRLFTVMHNSKIDELFDSWTNSALILFC